jgi:tripartite-type tricarboxylate transporter receptor subunit TctC
MTRAIKRSCCWQRSSEFAFDDAKHLRHRDIVGGHFIEMQHIPYKGASEVITALLSGAVQVMFVTPRPSSGS